MTTTDLFPTTPVALHNLIGPRPESSYCLFAAAAYPAMSGSFLKTGRSVATAADEISMKPRLVQALQEVRLYEKQLQSVMGGAN